jgi:hypothetical protein
MVTNLSVQILDCVVYLPSPSRSLTPTTAILSIPDSQFIVPPETQNTIPLSKLLSNSVLLHN